MTTGEQRLVKTVNRIAEQAHDNKVENKQSANQRRNTFVDIYGLEIQGQGDTNHPASFGISISPDLIYYERWEFKVAIRPFAMPISGGSVDAVAVVVDDENLTTDGTSINPNPHKHTTQPHTHTLTAGISFVPSTVEDFEVWVVEDDDIEINLTPYLKAQHPDEWPDGEGVFPRDDLAKFDIMEAVGHLYDWEKGVVLTAGYKKIKFRAKGTFNCSFVNYLKYSAVNR